MQDLEAFLAKVLKDLGALPEEGMRLDLLGRRLGSLDPEDAARLIDALLKTPGSGAKKAKDLFVLPDGLRGALGDSRYLEIRRACERLGFARAGRLLTGYSPHKKGFYGYDSEEEAAMEFVTLGQRRSMSKSPVKAVIDRLLSDPDPIVIGNLLNNPRITEKEVLKIASKRPNSADILKLVAAHRVWSKRYEVRKAVALNPYSLPAVSLALLEDMREQDLELICLDGSLHPELREGARQILEEKKAD